MSADLQAKAAAHTETLSAFGFNFASLWQLILADLPKAISLIETILPLLAPGSKLALALQAILEIIKPS